MNNTRQTLSSIEIRNLMLETLAYEGDDIDSSGYNFKSHNFQGTQSDLIRLLERLTVKKNLIPSTVKISDAAWGTHGRLLHEGYSTNFNNTEIKRIYEQFHVLLNHGIIAPGATGNYGATLPYFHVTDYGLECLVEQDILPYDFDGYLGKIRSISNISDWTVFYITESLRCFNANCMEASAIMIGLAAECIVDELNLSLLSFLSRNDIAEKNRMLNELNRKKYASEKYNVYKKYYNRKCSSITSQSFQQIKPLMNQTAFDAYMNFIRLTRNSLAHPSDFRMERTEILLIFVSFLKYCEIQYKFIDFFANNN